MIYTDKTRKALSICYEAHKDAYDKSGAPYVFHPFYVAEQMKDEVTTVVALLHDVVEDSDYTLEMLKEAGFGQDVVGAIALLTRTEDIHTDEEYMAYIMKIKENPIARAVKIADLTHNSDMTRLSVVTDKDIMRAAKYQRALMLLQ